MNIHEYQAKELFEKFGVPSPNGQVASTAEEAEAAANSIGGKGLVVKAQVHAGGRGKGTFKNGFKGGVHLADTAPEIKELAAQMLGQTLVTHQTGEEGRLVSKVMIAESVDIDKEFYLSILLDRATCRPVIVASTEGGMDIEEVAENTPEKIACDCDMVEINPLVLTPCGQVLALDAKFGFDDNALYRQKDIVEMRDTSEEDPREVEASKFDLNYIGLDGNIACLVNGAGLAMATMDIIKHCGGDPANFLDVGGGATKEQVAAAFKIILADPKVEGILVNIFGGIMQCDIIAEGILAAAAETGLSIPLVVRLEGTNVAKGRELIEKSDLAVIPADNLNDAAKKIVEAVKG